MFKFKKISLILMSLIISLSFISCESSNTTQNTSVQVNNIQSQDENEIKKKISEADKVAQSGQYLYAISKLKLVKSDCDFSKYPKLAEEIDEKQSNYEYKNYCIESLDKLKKKDFYYALCDLSEIVKNYNQKEGVKEVCANILKEIESNLNTTKSYNEYLSQMLVYVEVICPENKDSIKQLYNLNQSYTNEKHENFDEKIKSIENIRNASTKDIKKEPSIGMSKADVRNSIWGEPEHINQTITATVNHEQWVYSANRYVYFENEVVTAIQK